MRGKLSTNSALELDALMSTTLTASTRGVRRLDVEQMRGLAGLRAAPELHLGGEQQMLMRAPLDY